MIAGDYKVCCPNCSSVSFKLVDPHPLLQRQLSSIRASCENAEKGCKQVLAYGELDQHKTKCEYATLKCTNFGCEAEMFQRDFARHEETCEFRVIRCDKCDVVKQPDVEHDCIKSMAAKYEHLEGRAIALAQKLDLALERAERGRLDPEKGTKFERLDIPLPTLGQVKFNAQYGWQQ